MITADILAGPASSHAIGIAHFGTIRPILLVSCYSVRMTRYQLRYLGSATEAAIWSVIETNASVICACLITIKPALHFLFPEKLISTTRRSWSRLKSSHFSHNSKAHHESYTNPFDSVSHLQGGAPRIPLDDEPFTNGRAQTSTKAYSVPIGEVKVGHHESSPGDMV